MTIYSTLRDRALNQIGCLDQTEAQTVAQIALEECMKYIAFRIRVPSLIVKATQVTAPASPELEASAIALTGGAGTFAITSGVYQCPDRLFVKNSSTTTDYGTPYTYMEYHHFIDLKSIPAGRRIGVFEPSQIDERPQFCWTITPSDTVWIHPIAQNNVVTLFYRKNPAAYVAGNTPEILPRYDYILVNAAVLALKEWLREPETISTIWNLFEQALDADIQRYDLEINAMRKRSHLQIHRSYRPF